MRQTKSDTPFKAQNLKNDTQFKEARVSEHLRTRMLADIITVPNLRITPGLQR